MTESNGSSARDRVLEIVAGVDDQATASEILLAIHQQTSLEDASCLQRDFDETKDWNTTPTEGNRISQFLGCLMPTLGALLVFVLVFIMMPLLFSIGERFITRPLRVLDTGTIEELVWLTGKADEAYVGRKCQVLSRHLIVEKPAGEPVFIPSEQYRILALGKAN